MSRCVRTVCVHVFIILFTLMCTLFAQNAQPAPAPLYLDPSKPLEPGWTIWFRE